MLLAELSGPISNNIAGWNRDEFTESEKEHLKEAYSYLKGRRAILDYKPTTEINENEEEQTKVCRELLSQKTYLTLAICDDQLELPEPVINKFYSVEEALEENKLSHKEVVHF